MVTISAIVSRRGNDITISSSLPGDHTNGDEIKQFLKAMTDVWYEIYQETKALNERESSREGASV